MCLSDRYVWDSRHVVLGLGSAAPSDARIHVNVADFAADVLVSAASDGVLKPPGPASMRHPMAY